MRKLNLHSSSPARNCHPETLERCASKPAKSYKEPLILTVAPPKRPGRNQQLPCVAYASQARHMIQAAGVDSWFLKLPTGEWEEAAQTCAYLAGLIPNGMVLEEKQDLFFHASLIYRERVCDLLGSQILGSQRTKVLQ